MDITSQQFIALLAELKKIREHLDQLLNAVKEYKTTADNTAKGQQKQPAPPPEVKAELHLPRAIEDAVAKKANEDGRWLEPNVITSGLTALFTFLAFAAAFWYAYEAYIQTPKIEQSADAAKNANVQLMAIQRAYIGWVGMSTPIGFLSPSNKAEFRQNCFWQNTGNTLATTINRCDMQQLRDEPSEDEFVGDIRETVHIPVFPHGNPAGPQTQGRPEDFYINHGKARDNIYAWGWMAYRDIFPGSDPHVTEFCVKLTAIEFRSPTDSHLYPGANMGWGPCKSHMCVDNGCKDYEEIAKFAPK